MADSPSIHASAVLAGAAGVLIRGPAGAGKSRLALALIAAGKTGVLPFARLVADDRVRLEAAHGRVLASAPEELAGLIEVRGAGIRRVPFEAVARLDLVVDLAAADAERLPPNDARARICGIVLPRLALPPDAEALPAVLARLVTAATD